MELKEGMYYRYKGQIGKYQKITELDRYADFTNNYNRYTGFELLNNSKFSNNIIDLIEVGDYVDTHKVIDVYSPDGKRVFRIELEVDGLKGHMRCESKDIHSILTHEQFERMEYKVVE